MNTIQSKHLMVILKEMCGRVGVAYNDVDFRKDSWYMDFTWTEQEQEKFTVWLTNYLKNNKEARYELMRVPMVSKERLRKTADQFVLNYGWKLADKSIPPKKTTKKVTHL